MKSLLLYPSPPTLPEPRKPVSFPLRPSTSLPVMYPPVPRPSLAVVLVDFLSRKETSDRDVAGAVEEYVVRSIIGGKRVREWCSDILTALNRPLGGNVLTLILEYPASKVLLPYLRPNSSPTINAVDLHSSSLSPTPLSTISRRQLVDSLGKLSRDRAPIYRDSASNMHQAVSELCLEYIAKRWRSGIKEYGYDNNGNSFEIAENISNKLDEMITEVQFSGEMIIVRSIILPAIRELRLLLGFISVSNLITRLNKFPDQNAANETRPIEIHDGLTANHLFKAWINRRLMAGHEPEKIVEELLVNKDSIYYRAHREALFTILGDVGLLSNSQISEDFVMHYNSSQPDLSIRKHKRNFSLLSIKTFNSKSSLSTSGPPSTKWFPQRRIPVSTSTLSLPRFGSDRRPSLPTAQTGSLSLRGQCSSSSRPCNGSPNSPPSDSATPKVAAEQSDILSDLLSSMMTFSDGENIRQIILDHLLTLRYRMDGDGEDDWFLGTGRTNAQTILSSLETRLVGRKDVMGLKVVFDELRQAFDIVVKPEEEAQLSRSLSIRGRRRGKSSSAATGQSDCSSSTTLKASTEGSGESSASRPIIRERDVSFDLEQYISDISHPHIDSSDSDDSVVPKTENVSTLIPLSDYNFPSTSAIQLPDIYLGDEKQTNTNSWPNRHSLSALSLSSSTRQSVLSLDSRSNSCSRSRSILRESRISSFTIREAVLEYPSSTRAVKFEFPRSKNMSRGLSGCEETMEEIRGSLDYEEGKLGNGRFSRSTSDLGTTGGSLSVLDPNFFKKDENGQSGSVGKRRSGRSSFLAIPSTFGKEIRPIVRSESKIQPKPRLEIPPETPSPEKIITQQRRGSGSEEPIITPRYSHENFASRMRAPISPPPSPSVDTIASQLEQAGLGRGETSTPSGLRTPSPIVLPKRRETTSPLSLNQPVTPGNRIPSTPDSEQRSRRQLFRKFAIVDGEPVSPSSTSVFGDGNNSLSEVATGKGQSSPDDSGNNLRIPPSSPGISLIPHRRNTEDTISSVSPTGQAGSIPLEIILSIFAPTTPNPAAVDGSDKGRIGGAEESQKQRLKPRDGLTSDQLEIILKSMINEEVERVEKEGGYKSIEETTSNLKWIFNQLELLLKDYPNLCETVKEISKSHLSNITDGNQLSTPRQSHFPSSSPLRQDTPSGNPFRHNALQSLIRPRRTPSLGSQHTFGSPSPVIPQASLDGAAWN